MISIGCLHSISEKTVATAATRLQLPSRPHHCWVCRVATTKKSGGYRRLHASYSVATAPFCSHCSQCVATKNQPSGYTSIPWYIRPTEVFCCGVATVATIFVSSFTRAHEAEKARATLGGPLVPVG